MRLPTIILLFTIYSHIYAQYESFGARSAALSETSVNLLDAFASYNNPSILAFDTNARIGFGYRNSYLLNDIHEFSLVSSIPIKKIGTFSASMYRFGNNDFSHQRLGINYAKNFGKVFSVGIQFNLHYIHIGDIYGNLVTASGGLSSTIKPIKNWIIGVNIQNITATSITANPRENIFTIFRLGSSYLFSNKFLVSIEGEASIQYNPNFKFGFEYTPISILRVRAGFMTFPLSPSFGFGIEFKKINFDFAGKYHPSLGFSPIASLSYKFGK